MWQKNVWLIKREGSAVLKSWKHREISFFHEFIFVFALYIIGLEVWKKHTKEGWLCKGVVYRSVCVCVCVCVGLKPSAHYVFMVLSRFNK